MLKGFVRSARPVIESQTDLRNALVAAHQQMIATLGRKYFIDLVESMPRRLAAVRAANGGHTRYQWQITLNLNKILKFLKLPIEIFI